MLPTPTPTMHTASKVAYTSLSPNKGIYHKIEKTCTKGQEKTTHDIKQKKRRGKQGKETMQGGYGVINR